MWGFLDKPGELERTRAVYHERIDELERQANDIASDAEAIHAESVFHREKADEAEARVLELTAALERPVVLDEVPAPVAPVVIARAPPEVVQRIRYFEDVFAPQAKAYADQLQDIVNAQAEEISYLKRAHEGAEAAAEKWRLAYETERERANVATARVEEYESAFFRRRGVMVGIGAAVVVAIAVALGG